MILFFGRKNDNFSQKLLKFIKKKSKKKVKTYLTEKHNQKLNVKIQSYDYIFSFRNYYKIPKNLLLNCKNAAINFHPGPPNYRGIGCLNFALLNNEKYYGVTAHIINEKIDNGKILSFKKFRLKKTDNINTLLQKTHLLQYKQAKELISKIFAKNFNYNQMLIKNKKKYNWSQKLYTKKDLENLYSINLNLKKKDLKKIIRATNYKTYKPYILFKGFKFLLYEKKN